MAIGALAGIADRVATPAIDDGGAQAASTATKSIPVDPAQSDGIAAHSVGQENVAPRSYGAPRVEEPPASVEPLTGPAAAIRRPFANQVNSRASTHAPPPRRPIENPLKPSAAQSPDAFRSNLENSFKGLARSGALRQDLLGLNHEEEDLIQSQSDATSVDEWAADANAQVQQKIDAAVKAGNPQEVARLENVRGRIDDAKLRADAEVIERQRNDALKRDRAQDEARKELVAKEHARRDHEAQALQPVRQAERQHAVTAQKRKIEEVEKLQTRVAERRHRVAQIEEQAQDLPTAPNIVVTGSRTYAAEAHAQEVHRHSNLKKIEAEQRLGDDEAATQNAKETAVASTQALPELIGPSL